MAGFYFSEKLRNYLYLETSSTAKVLFSTGTRPVRPESALKDKNYQMRYHHDMNTDFGNFQDVFQWVIAHSSFIIFLVMCIEGPMTTAAAGFAAAAGYFNPAWILFLSVSGDLVPDSLYYLVGYRSRIRGIERIARYFKLTPEKVAHTETLLKKHFGKTMLILKLTPIVTTVGFALVGYLKIPFRKFFVWCSIVTIPKSIIFLSIGYFFGHLYVVNAYIHNASLLLAIFAVATGFFYFVYMKVSSAIAQKVEKI